MYKRQVVGGALDVDGVAVLLQDHLRTQGLGPELDVYKRQGDGEELDDDGAVDIGLHAQCFLLYTSRCV